MRDDGAGLARGDREGSGPDAGWDRLLLLQSIGAAAVAPSSRHRASKMQLDAARKHRFRCSLSKIKSGGRYSTGAKAVLPAVYYTEKINGISSYIMMIQRDNYLTCSKSVKEYYILLCLFAHMHVDCI